MTTTDAVAESFGARIKEARTTRGWSQTRLAEVLELNPSSVSRLEAGRQRLSLDQAARIASSLGVSLDALLEPATPEAEFRAAVTAADAAAGGAEEALATLFQAALQVHKTAAGAPTAARVELLDDEDPDEAVQGLRFRVERRGPSATVVAPDGEVSDLLEQLAFALAQRVVTVAEHG